jgi:hypothetical protein
MFYNTTGAHKPGPIWINGSATVDLRAPTEGAYASVLFFQDHDMPGTKPNQLAGTAELAIVAPLLLFILIGTVDLGPAAYEAIDIENAVHAGRRETTLRVD